jgi:hypothetical protein
MKQVEGRAFMRIRKAVKMGLGLSLGIGLVAAIIPDNDPDEATATIPAGTTFVAALQQDLTTLVAHTGDEFEVRTVQSVRLRDGVEIPAGSVISGEVIDARDGTTSAGQPPELAIRFTELVIAGDDQETEIKTEQFRFGTLALGAPARHIVVPAGRRLTIRLSKPVTVEYLPNPESIRAAE